jgi:hypothetical protein
MARYGKVGRSVIPQDVTGFLTSLRLRFGPRSEVTTMIVDNGIPRKVKGRPAEVFLVTPGREVSGLQYYLDLRPGVDPRGQDSGHVHPLAKGDTNDKTG